MLEILVLQKLQKSLAAKTIDIKHTLFRKNTGKGEMKIEKIGV
jgi:hypothetical protein